MTHQILDSAQHNGMPHAADEQPCSLATVSHMLNSPAQHKAQHSQYIHAQSCLPLHFARHWLCTLLRTLMKPQLRHPAAHHADPACRKDQRLICDDLVTGLLAQENTSCMCNQPILLSGVQTCMIGGSAAADAAILMLLLPYCLCCCPVCKHV
jgi:hypothetical protein